MKFIAVALLVASGISTASDEQKNTWYLNLFGTLFGMHEEDPTVTPEIVFHDTMVGTIASNIPQILLLDNGMQLQRYVADYELSEQYVVPCALAALSVADYKTFDDLLESH